MSRAGEDGAAPAEDRVGWRLRQLARRYLATSGGWYAASAAARGEARFDAAAFVDRFLDEGVASPVRAQVARADAELGEERAGRGALPAGPWRRLQALLTRIGAEALEEDALLLLAGVALDGQMGALLALLAGGSPAAPPLLLPEPLLRRLLDPLDAHLEETGRAIGVDGILARAGLLVWSAAGDGAARVGLHPSALAFLRGAAAGMAVPDWAVAVEAARCADEGERIRGALPIEAAAVQAALGSPGRVVVTGSPGCGARGLAALGAARLGTSLLLLDGARLGSVDAGTLRVELLLREAALLVSGWPSTSGTVSSEGEAAWIRLLSTLPTPLLVMHLPADVDPGLCHRVVLGLSAARVAIGEAPPTQRASWWRTALADLPGPRSDEANAWPARLQVRPVAFDHVEPALAAGLAAGGPDPVPAILEACRRLDPRPLDGLARPLSPPARPHQLPDDEAALRLEALRLGIEQGAWPDALLAVEASAHGSASEAAAFVGGLLGVEVFALPDATEAELAGALAAARQARAALFLDQLDSDGADRLRHLHARIGGIAIASPRP